MIPWARLVLRPLGASLLTTFFLIAAAEATGRSREIVLLRKPALVKARLLRDEGVDIQIRYAGRTESVSTGLMGVTTYADAVRHLRKVVAWRKPYLFVVSECGGGTDWACDMEHVFKIQGGRLAKLGSFIVDEVVEPIASSSYDHGHFLDGYNKLEDSVNLSHGGAPYFEIALRDRNGHLAVELEETWLMNRRAVLDVLTDDEPPDGDCLKKADEGCVAPYAKALAIALYCDRKDLAGQLVAKAKRVLHRDDLAKLAKLKRQVVPGELPSEFRKHHSWGDEYDVKDDGGG